MLYVATVPSASAAVNPLIVVGPALLFIDAFVILFEVGGVLIIGIV